MHDLYVSHKTWDICSKARTWVTRAPNTYMYFCIYFCAHITTYQTVKAYFLFIISNQSVEWWFGAMWIFCFPTTFHLMVLKFIDDLFFFQLLHWDLQNGDFLLLTFSPHLLAPSISPSLSLPSFEYDQEFTHWKFFQLITITCSYYFSWPSNLADGSSYRLTLVSLWHDPSIFEHSFACGKLDVQGSLYIFLVPWNNPVL